MEKILLDTDIGTDIDDAVCLAYLLAQPECELVGITTVTGEAEKRAALASVLCRAAGKDIPIYPGAERPMQGEQKQLIAQQAAVLPRWAHQKTFIKSQAVEFMAHTIRSHPGEVTLLTVGPLTNAGQLFIAFPEVIPLLKGLVIMGGLFQETELVKGWTEWNVSGDPLSTEIVYQTPVPMHRSVGIEITQLVVMGADEVRRRFTAPILRPVLDMAEIWFKKFFPAITFHDPLTAATIFDGSICSFEVGSVMVDHARDPNFLTWHAGGQKLSHQVAVKVYPDRYFRHFFATVGGYVPGRKT